jgi:Taurine catabolism dioxygenase TauD, TfdA family
MTREPLKGRAAWHGKELDASGDWIRTLDDTQRREIDDALARIKRARAPQLGFTRDDFPLASTADLLGLISDELENGRGMVRLRGLPVEHYSDDDIRQIFCGIGAHLGTAVYQNARAEIMGEVRDETKLPTRSYAPLEAGKIASSRARARSTGPLRWHTDRCDVIALLCVRNAKAGGISKLTSIVTIYNEILRRRPDLLELLCQDYWRARPTDEDGPTSSRAFALPVFGVRDGKLTCQYSRTYVEQAQELPEVPRITAAQNEALDLLAAVAEEVCLYSPFVPGDIQLLNNHVIFHGRTAYEDDSASHQERLLFRLWLSMPNSRPLPRGFEAFWGSADPGALRGGVLQPGTGGRTSLTVA